MNPQAGKPNGLKSKNLGSQAMRSLLLMNPPGNVTFHVHPTGFKRGSISMIVWRPPSFGMSHVHPTGSVAVMASGAGHRAAFCLLE
ncbi:hypothetical protein AVEN_103128-1 [Araneus ventricosus]|uniref:Uncharacterized protein n=1 Tax=Araneus ventricosus TaxID=182803 RepID=A0A4Y2K3Y6_ARAVE|nr:hypothetical protein AVEN_103128-1 [Araneus ventricosus]